MRSRRRAGGDGRGSTRGPARPPHKHAPPCTSGSEPKVVVPEASWQGVQPSWGWAIGTSLWTGGSSGGGEHSVCFLVPSLTGSFPETKTDLGLAQTLSAEGVDRVAAWAFSTQETESSAGESLL